MAEAQTPLNRSVLIDNATRCQWNAKKRAREFTKKKQKNVIDPQARQCSTDMKNQRKNLVNYLFPRRL